MFIVYIDTPSCETGSIIFNANFIIMEQEENKPWVINGIEAKNRTANTIYRKYKEIIDDFNKNIIEQCNNCKTFLYYTTKDEKKAKHLAYFYTIVGYNVEMTDKEEVLETVYKLKIMW